MEKIGGQPCNSEASGVDGRLLDFACRESVEIGLQHQFCISCSEDTGSGRELDLLISRQFGGLLGLRFFPSLSSNTVSNFHLTG
jgi:hypothetical protein